jgi:hypothetical protein
VVFALILRPHRLANFPSTLRGSDRSVHLPNHLPDQLQNPLTQAFHHRIHLLPQDRLIITNLARRYMSPPRPTANHTSRCPHLQYQAFRCSSDVCLRLTTRPRSPLLQCGHLLPLLVQIILTLPRLVAEYTHPHRSSFPCLALDSSCLPLVPPCSRTSAKLAP